MKLSRWVSIPLFTAVVLVVIAVIPLGLAATLVYPRLPSLETMRHYHPKVPLRVYTEDGALIGEFGVENRALVKIDQVPKLMKEAIISAEDDRFYKHHGVDYIGVMRAALADLVNGGKVEGASTITMQVARNFFLSNEKTFSRKISEVLLAWKIEHNFTKDQILELYINQIYLGQRAYGFEAASETYFGKHLKQLNLAEMAVLAGLPKAPSSFNPIASLSRCRERQHYVLGRMLALKYITKTQYEAALKTPIIVRHAHFFDVRANYVAEMVREAMYSKYGPSIYTSGMKVYTTLRRADQAAADVGLHDEVMAYDHRHGYRGPEGKVSSLDPVVMEDRLSGLYAIQGLEPAVVLSASARRVEAYLQGGRKIWINGAGLSFASSSLKVSSNHRIVPGSIIRVERVGKSWQISQLPLVEAAFISVDPKTGAILALDGGFDYSANKFNHVIQAWRQPGSSFKPFIYSAALEKGFTPASVINDSPLSLPNGSGGIWQPKDYEDNFEGPMRLRDALAKSKNLVAIRLLMAIGTKYAQNYVTRFGFSPSQIPDYLTMALGAVSVTPLQMAEGYSVFANGGYLVKPYFIDRIVDESGRVLSQSHPVQAGKGAQRVIDARNAFIMTSMMQSVVQYGTAAAAMSLGRHDLAGKTGTTNQQVDGWFCGYNPKVVAIAWMGFDKPQPLGRGETGANVALPIWMHYMGSVLKGTPDIPMPVPSGVVVAQIDKTTGLLSESPVNSMSEFFYQEYVPGRGAPVMNPEQPVLPGQSVPLMQPLGPVPPEEVIQPSSGSSASTSSHAPPATEAPWPSSRPNG